MESRIQLEGKLHFFEHYSIQKLEEYLRNALYYSIEILTTRNPRFVDLRYKIKELCMGMELIFQGIFLIWKNASFHEYFYSYSRNNTSRLRKLLSIVGMILIPYALTKLRQKQQQAEGKRKLALGILESIYNLWDFWLKVTYLLGGEDYVFYSPYYKLFGIQLQRMNKQLSKWDKISQYGTLALFIGLKFLDYYYQKKEVNFSQQEVVLAPKIQQKQNVCAICKKQINNPTFLQTTGMVYCYKCIFEWVKEFGQCPITKQKVNSTQIMKIYQ